ncbi:MAG TPA: MATE family efflux transporter, partial [Sphingomonas sp.]|nr:MATE family efflux transporter [Sphingomonas sp.]
AEWRCEIRALIRLANPLILANLGWALIAGTDLFWLARIGPEAVAAGALALNLYQLPMIFGIGLVTACSPLIANARARRLHAVRQIRRTVHQTWWAAGLFSLLTWALLRHGEALLLALGQDKLLAARAASLLAGIQWALFPYLCFLVLRNFTSALERPYWAVAVMALAIPFNAGISWLLIFGHFGVPPLGLFGAGMANTLTTFFLFLGMAIATIRDRQFRSYRLFGRLWVADWPRLRIVAQIGLPIAITLLLEATVYNGATFLMGLFGERTLAAHAIAVQISMPFFMVPVGIAQATAVRVAFAHGRHDRGAIGRAGWLGLALGFGFACFAAAILLAIPGSLVGLFIDERTAGTAGVAHSAIAFLGIAAIYQFVDAAQIIAAGALRGLQDTRTPMLIAILSYWGVGLGSGALLASTLKIGAIGIWIGIALGLSTIAGLLVARWAYRSRLPQIRVIN